MPLAAGAIESLDVGRDAAIFFTWAAVALALCFSSIYAAHRHGDTVGFVLAPLLCLALLWENVSIAIAALVGEGGSDGVLSVRGAVHAFIIPLFLVTMFEINYTVHKKRGVNFFCIAFDQGHRATGFVRALIRYSMWLIALAILLLQICVDSSYTAVPSAAPRTSRFTYKGFSLTHLEAVQGMNWQDAVDFFPWMFLFAFSLYTGLSLWRYGSTISTDVRSSSLNPWCSIFLATAGLIVAWFLSPPSWPLPYATNILELCLAGSIGITIGLVESNLRTLESWQAILALANEELLRAQARRDQVEVMVRQQLESKGRSKSSNSSRNRKERVSTALQMVPLPIDSHVGRLPMVVEGSEPTEHGGDHDGETNSVVSGSIATQPGADVGSVSRPGTPTDHHAVAVAVDFEGTREPADWAVAGDRPRRPRGAGAKGSASTAAPKT